MKTITGRTVNAVRVTQNISDLRNLYPHKSVLPCKIEYRTRSNNWLKMHKIPMRRKPLTREWIIHDEAWLIYKSDAQYEKILQNIIDCSKKRFGRR